MENIQINFLKKIEKAFQKNTWELKTLGEVATEINFGCVITREQLGTGNYPAIKCGDVNSGLPLQFHKCINYVNPDLIKNKRYFEFGNILLSDLSNKLETLGKCCVYLGNEKCICGNNVAIINHSQNPKYLAYCLSSDFCRKQIEFFSQNSTVFRIYPKNIKQIKVPLPPRHIQDKIADYLDKFTELSEELSEELKERKEQYEYFRDKIIGRNEEEIEWEIKTLGEVATTVYNGNEITREQLGTGDYPAIKCGDINSGLNVQFHKCINFVNPNLVKNKKYFGCGDILISNLSNKLDTLGKSVVYLGNEKCLSGNHVIVVKHKYNAKYLAFALNTNFYKQQIKKYSTNGTVYDFPITKIKQIKIPLPPLEEQERIVSILDKFHTLCGDIEQGIPALIEENKKQYEYYKNAIIS